MRYVDGDTLKKYLEQNGKMSPEDVLKVMKPIMKALEQMHRTGLIHRDVSPDNIMIRRDGQVKLIDFGSARVAQEDDEKSLTIMLKRGFSPEEQYRSKGHQGAWTDIYALCATMYYMLTGKIPPEAMERLANDEYKSLKTYDDVKIDKKIASAIDKGLCVFAKDRYQSMSDLIYDIYGEEEKRVIPKNERMSTGDVSSVGETVLDENSTVLMEDNNKTVLMDDAEKMGKVIGGRNTTLKFNSKKKVMAVIVVICVFVLGGIGVFAAVRSGNRAEKSTDVVSQEKAIKTPTASPSPTAEITATPEIKKMPLPNCVNQKVDTATQQVWNLSKNVNIKTSEVYSDSVPAGVIVSQAPEAGSMVNTDEFIEVTFVVSKGQQLMTIPDVKGKSLSAAKAKLKKSGLKYKTKTKYSSSYSSGKVISQSKKAGTKVKKKTTVHLVVSRGPKPTPKPQATPRPTVRPQRHTTSSSSSSKKSKKSKKKSDFQVIGSDDYVVLD